MPQVAPGPGVAQGHPKCCTAAALLVAKNKSLIYKILSSRDLHDQL